MENRQRIIAAAARVYGEHGFRGATTRRIAAEAGVNEVTLFRIFGSKAALLAETVRLVTEMRREGALPDRPVHPERELVAWAEQRHASMMERRSIIRTVLNEMEMPAEIADCAGCAREEPQLAHEQLRGYLAALRREGMLAGDVDPYAASAMLHGVLFADAIGRDLLPGIFPEPPSKAVREYVRLFLRGIGVDGKTTIGAKGAKRSRAKGAKRSRAKGAKRSRAKGAKRTAATRMSNTGPSERRRSR